jgi:hypothetical protein
MPDQIIQIFKYWNFYNKTDESDKMFIKPSSYEDKAFSKRAGMMATLDDDQLGPNCSKIKYN